MYRNTVHSTANETPAKLMFGRSTRTIFDLLIQNMNRVVINNQITQIKNSGKKDINVKEGDMVLVKNYRNKNENWQKRKITETISQNTH